IVQWCHGKYPFHYRDANGDRATWLSRVGGTTAASSYAAHVRAQSGQHQSATGKSRARLPGTSLKRRAEMQKMKEAASEFLAKKRVAVTGVSRNPQGHGSNVVYQRLRQRGYQVFAVNPNVDNVEGDPCY